MLISFENRHCAGMHLRYCREDEGGGDSGGGDSGGGDSGGGGNYSNEGRNFSSPVGSGPGDSQSKGGGWNGGGNNTPTGYEGLSKTDLPTGGIGGTYGVNMTGTQAGTWGYDPNTGRVAGNLQDAYREMLAGGQTEREALAHILGEKNNLPGKLGLMSSFARTASEWAIKNGLPGYAMTAADRAEAAARGSGGGNRGNASSNAGINPFWNNPNQEQPPDWVGPNIRVDDGPPTLFARDELFPQMADSDMWRKRLNIDLSSLDARRARLSDSGYRSQRIATTGADIQQGFDTAQGQSNRNLLRLGLNPNSSKFAAAQAQQGLGLATSKAQAANTERQAMDKEDLGYLTVGSDMARTGLQTAQSMDESAKRLNLAEQQLNMQKLLGLASIDTSRYNAETNRYNAETGRMTGNSAISHQQSQDNPWSTIGGALVSGYVGNSDFRNFVNDLF